MRLMKILSAAIAVSILFGTAYAHSGQTDSNGGHYNHSTGEYHYHHGYPAHQHTDGVCPYDYDDRTGQNSGGGGYEKSDGEEKVILASEPKPKISKNDASGFIFIGYLVAFIIFLAVDEIAPQKKNTRKPGGRRK